MKVDRKAIMIFGDSMSDVDGVQRQAFGPGRKHQSVWTKQFKKEIDPHKNSRPAKRFEKYRSFHLEAGGPEYGGSEFAVTSRGTQDHLPVLEKALKKTNPGVVVFAITPWNERLKWGGRYLTHEETRANLIKLIRMAHAAGSKVLVIAFPPTNRKYYPTAEKYAEAEKLAKVVIDAAQDEKVSVVKDYYAPLRVNGQVPLKDICDDTIHLKFNARSERRLFDNVMQKLAPLMDAVLKKPRSLMLNLADENPVSVAVPRLQTSGESTLKSAAAKEIVGLVAFDRDGDGTFGRDETFFDEETASTDSPLVPFDSNGNGKLDAADASWKKFAVWVDADRNGSAEAGEFRSLDQLGIASLSLSSKRSGEESDAASVLGTAQYTTKAGRIRSMAEISFGAPSDTLSSAEIARRRDLLAQAMSQNAAGSSTLHATGRDPSGLPSVTVSKL